MKIHLSTTGNFEKSFKKLERLKQIGNSSIFDKYGEKGVQALAETTPVRTGLTATSWMYEIEHNAGSTTITWSNTNVHNGVNIALILNHGHGTRNGGYVRGLDYINPALEPVFEQMKNDLWREVTKS